MRDRPTIPPRQLTAIAVFEPNGAQRMEIFLPGWGRDVALDAEEVAQLEAKIAAFKRAAAFENGRPVERTHRHREAL